MIKGFKNKETKLVYEGQYSKGLSNNIQKVVLRKLILIDNALDVNDLRVPPDNHLEQLTGDRAGQYSIRVNDQYRTCFTFENGDFYDVEITDYH